MNDRDAADIVLARITDEEQLVVDTMSTREINALKKAYIALMDKANQPSCGDYASKKAAANVLCDACGNVACQRGLIPRCFFYEKMMELPAADVAPVVRGRWKTLLRHEHWPSADTFEADYCSVCGRRGSKEFLFCPNCGARMDEVSG